MPRRWSRSVENYLSRRINRAPSPVLARGVPWASVMLASMLPAWPIIASAPVVPPLGFLLFLAWRHVRPGLHPVWAGLPLGLFDDIYSGQPFGSGILLWSLTALAADTLDHRIPFRSFALDWLLSGVALVLYLAASLAIANLAGGKTPLAVIAPQLLIAILLYPLCCRLVARFDRFRLLPIVDLG
jgi:rod shape-determining protein MreD